MIKAPTEDLELNVDEVLPCAISSRYWLAVVLTVIPVCACILLEEGDPNANIVIITVADPLVRGSTSNPIVSFISKVELASWM